MCMGATVTPTPVQSAPQVTPPAQSPDGGMSGTTAMDKQRRRAVMAVGLGAGARVNPLGNPATTANSGNLLG